MAGFQGVLFLILGVGLLAVDAQSLSKGVLPCGSRGLSGRLEFSRTEQPCLYWLMFAVYAAIGLWLIVIAVRILTGVSAPLPLR